MRRILLFIVILGIAAPCFSKARYAGKEEMIQEAEFIAIVTITGVEAAEKKAKTWTYRQKAMATVERRLKGDAADKIEIYGMETFICAQCRYEKGRFILFLRKDEGLWVGSNWQLGIRPIKKGNVAWFNDEQVPLSKVVEEIETVLREQKEVAPSRPVIVIDGEFDDWKSLPLYTDPENDQIDTDGNTPDYKGIPRKNRDIDILEFRVTHDAENLLIYLRTAGKIGNTQKEGEGKKAGRYYVTLAIDVDQDDKTGYWLHEGGTYPTSPGYDVNAEIEWYNGAFNTGMYMNKCCLNPAELKQSFLDLSQGNYKEGEDGPYPAGFHTIKPGHYADYAEWVYHENGTITFVRDKGPVVYGVLTGKRSPDWRQLEMKIPFVGFLKDQHGDPVVQLGDVLDISFNLQASGELAADKEWAGDAAEPIEGYRLEP
jgi:hypothetical protein